MTQLSRERLEEIRDYDTCVTLEESAEMARRLLAVEGQEPVAYMYPGDATECRSVALAEDLDDEQKAACIQLYAAPQPAPVAQPIGITDKSEIECLKRGEMANVMPPDYKGVDAGDEVYLYDAPVAQPELTVWYGSMPETNGKANWTAILHRKEECLSTGITIDRSEYPERVRYEADRVRHIIGELKEEPDILAYDADAHSGYVPPAAQPVQVPPEKPHTDGLLADGWNACRAAMLQQSSGALQLPEGYVLVPVEPTPKQWAAGVKAMETGIDKATLAYRAMLAAAPQEPTKCWCHTCRPVTMTDMRFVVCPECGNKRCPHANDHRHACSGSNKPGQEGSAYPEKQEPTK
jgi:hypothetical protein